MPKKSEDRKKQCECKEMVPFFDDWNNEFYWCWKCGALKRIQLNHGCGKSDVTELFRVGQEPTIL